MGNMTKHVGFGFALLLLCASACKDKPSTCGIPGSKQDCDCSDGRTGGMQTCRDEVWTECVCPGEPIVDSGADTGAGTGGTGGTVGTGGTGGDSGSGGVGGTGDSGVDSGVDAGGTGGMGGTGGTGGDGGTGGSFPAAYSGPCTMDMDCGPDAVCFRSGAKSYCAPECTAANTCPAPPAGGAPTVDCIAAALGGPTGCHLTCTSLGGCPAGMACEGFPFPNQCF